VDTLAIHLNRGEPHAVESQSTFETDGSFALRLDNHGPPAHVYLRTHSDLADTTRIETPNHYVEDREIVDIEVTEDRPEEVTGRLEVVTGYGAESTDVAVTLTTPDRVVVDESLSTPDAADRGGGIDPRTAAAGGLAALAVLLAGALAATSGDIVAVLIGVIAVLVAAGTALYVSQFS